VDVDRTAAIPAWIDGGELDLPAVVRDLVAAQKFLAAGDDGSSASTGIVGGLIGIDTDGVAMPDTPTSGTQLELLPV
jgi:hypothetical protein